MTKNTGILLGIIVLKFVLQYALVSPIYDLHRDEYLHLDQGSHLAWGYVSVPPFTSWVAFMVKCLGSGVFWVRFFPALFGVLTIVVVWKTIGALGGHWLASALGAICVLFSSLLRLNILFQPNSFDVLCWTAFYYIVIRYIQSEDKKWLYAGAVIFALGFLNKYNFVFLLLGLLSAIILTKHRKIFLCRSFYFAVALGALLILPNLLWQYQNDFPVFHHLKLLEQTQLVHVDRMDFLVDQLLFFIGAIVVLVSSIVGLILYPPFKSYRIFAWSMLFTLAIFMFFKAKSYYAIGIYPIYIAFGSVYLTRALSWGWKRYLLPIAFAVPVLLFIPISRVAFPNKDPNEIVRNPQEYQDYGLLRWEDGKDHLLPQDFADMLGWKELAQKVDAICNQLPNRNQTLILCDNYGQAGAINYYSKNKDVRAVSFNADYLDWFLVDTKIENLVRVKEVEGSTDEMETTSPFFATARLADSIANPLAREYRTAIFVFSQPKIDIRQRLREEIATEKSER